MGLLEHVCDDIKRGVEGFWARDGHTSEQIWVQLRLVACLADNPRANQMCCNLQGSTEYFWRYCFVKRSAALFFGTRRHKDVTLQQLELIASGAVSGSAFGLRAGATALFRIAHFDPHAGLPLELLLLIPLGIIKYVALLLKETVLSRSNEVARANLEAMFNAVPTFPGHRVQGVRVVRWIGSMVGKDFGCDEHKFIP
ncbi:hypothetical protein RI367_002911 [Sorochytrium milnesiophthora]